MTLQTPRDVLADSLNDWLIDDFQQEDWDETAADHAIEKLAEAGYVIVPKEPTGEMVEAGCQAAQQNLTPWDNPSWDREPAHREATRAYVRDAIRAAFGHGELAREPNDG